MYIWVQSQQQFSLQSAFRRCLNDDPAFNGRSIDRCSLCNTPSCFVVPAAIAGTGKLVSCARISQTSNRRRNVRFVIVRQASSLQRLAAVTAARDLWSASGCSISSVPLCNLPLASISVTMQLAMRCVLRS